VAVFEDFGGLPRENWVDSLDTAPVGPNDFWEYELVIDPPFELDAGTWWIGTSGIFDIYGMNPSYSSTTSFNRRPTEGNGTEMYYRMPRDGYGYGWDTWQSLSQVVVPGTLSPELCAMVLGRSASTPRSVTGYNIYRLHPGEEIILLCGLKLLQIILILFSQMKRSPKMIRINMLWKQFSQVD